MSKILTCVLKFLLFPRETYLFVWSVVSILAISPWWSVLRWNVGTGQHSTALCIYL